MLLIKHRSTTLSRLEPRAVPPSQSSITTRTWDDVTLVCIDEQIFKVSKLNNTRVYKLLHVPGSIPNRHSTAANMFLSDF
jgi:hypothetical protein